MCEKLCKFINKKYVLHTQIWVLFVNKQVFYFFDRYVYMAAVLKIVLKLLSINGPHRLAASPA